MPMMAFIGVRISWLMLAQEIGLDPGVLLGHFLGQGHGLLGGLLGRDVHEGADQAAGAAIGPRNPETKYRVAWGWPSAKGIKVSRWTAAHSAMTRSSSAW